MEVGLLVVPARRIRGRINNQITRQGNGGIQGLIQASVLLIEGMLCRKIVQFVKFDPNTLQFKRKKRFLDLLCCVSTFAGIFLLDKLVELILFDVGDKNAVGKGSEMVYQGKQFSYILIIIRISYPKGGFCPYHIGD